VQPLVGIERERCLLSLLSRKAAQKACRRIGHCGRGTAGGHYRPNGAGHEEHGDQPETGRV
jgi:hypothetical protein